MRLARAAQELIGERVSGPGFEDAARRAAEAAHKQCSPLPNIPGDHEYRRDMVPVYVRRTILAATRDAGPVHHV